MAVLRLYRIINVTARSRKAFAMVILFLLGAPPLAGLALWKITGMSYVGLTIGLFICALIGVIFEKLTGPYRQ